MRAYCFFIGWALPFLLSAQEAALHWGAAHTQWQDPQLTPLLLSGYSMAGGLSYTRHKPSHYRRFQLLYTVSDLKSAGSGTYTESSNTTRYNHGQMNHFELWTVHQQKAFSAMAGFIGHLTVSFRKHHYIGGLTEDQFEGALGFGPALGLGWQAQETIACRVLLGAPLLHYALTKRHSPRYFSTKWIGDPANLRGPGRFALLHAEAGAQWAISNRAGLSLAYQLQYIHLQIARRQRSLQHRLLFGLHFKWLKP